MTYLKNFHKLFKILAKEELKNNKDLKHQLLVLKDHFKNYGWVLDHGTVLNESKVKCQMTFNKVLELKKYKIFYCKKSLRLMITKGKK